MIKMNEMCDFLIVGRDSYKQKYKDAKVRKESAIEILQRDFRPGTQRFKEEKQSIEQRFMEEVQAAKKEAHDFLDDKFLDLQSYEMSRVETLGNLEELQKLNAIADLPMSSMEVRLLAQKYGGKNYYYDKILNQIAEKNGIPSRGIETLGLRPNVDVKMHVLEQLRQQFNDLLDNYKGDMNYKTEVLLADSVVYRAEKLFTNGYNEGNMDDEAVARRAFTNILQQKNDMERGLTLREVMKNANDSIQREILYKCANSNIIGEFALEIAGVTEAVEAYRGGLGVEYEKAKKILQDVKDCKDDIDLIKVVIRENKDNEMFLKLCESECMRSSAVNDAACDINLEAHEILIHTVIDLDRQTTAGIAESSGTTPQ